MYVIIKPLDQVTSPSVIESAKLGVLIVLISSATVHYTRIFRYES